VKGLDRMWERIGMRVVTMTADHHDKVLAVTSHLPHLIAYAICNARSAGAKATNCRSSSPAPARSATPSSRQSQA
jgi:cyclohexadieny/prephenate dehydrogenase